MRGCVVDLFSYMVYQMTYQKLWIWAFSHRNQTFMFIKLEKKYIKIIETIFSHLDVNQNHRIRCCVRLSKGANKQTTIK